MLVRSAQAYNYSRKAGRAPDKGTIIKTRSFFLLTYFFVTVSLELLGLIIKKPAFSRLFTHLTGNFFRLDFKKSARYTVYKTYNYTKQDQYVFNECHV